MSVGLMQFTGSPDPWQGLDGRLNAPTGTILFPHLLDLNSPSTQTYGRTYIKRPAWEVPGVDYPVGIDRSVYATDAALSDPLPGGTFATASLAADFVAQCGGAGNVSVDSLGRIVISGATNITIQGWDFSLHGGLELLFKSNNNGVKFKYNKFVRGTNTQVVSGTSIGIPIQTVDATTDNITIEYNDIDGNGFTINTNTGDFGLIDIGGAPHFIFQYNLIKNATNELIRYNAQTQVTIQYNIIYNAGLGQVSEGAHGDWIQILGNATSGPNSNISFNLFLQDTNPSTVGGSQGLSFNGNAGGFLGGTATCNNNVMIAEPPVAAHNMNVLFNPDMSRLQYLAANNNYFDSYGLTVDGTFGISFWMDPVGGTGSFNYANGVSGQGNYDLYTGLLLTYSGTYGSITA